MTEPGSHDPHDVGQISQRGVKMHELWDLATRDPSLLLPLASLVSSWSFSFPTHKLGVIIDIYLL